ncbi:hypothetical protein Tco_0765058 [Tanacetum coccineum]
MVSRMTIGFLAKALQLIDGFDVTHARKAVLLILAENLQDGETPIVMICDASRIHMCYSGDKHQIVPTAVFRDSPAQQSPADWSISSFKLSRIMLCYPTPGDSGLISKGVASPVMARLGSVNLSVRGSRRWSPHPPQLSLYLLPKRCWLRVYPCTDKLSRYIQKSGILGAVSVLISCLATDCTPAPCSGKGLSAGLEWSTKATVKESDGSNGRQSCCSVEWVRCILTERGKLERRDGTKGSTLDVMQHASITSASITKASSNASMGGVKVPCHGDD